MASSELARHLAEVSWEIKRQVGVLIDRKGHVVSVIVGNDHELTLPHLRRLKAGLGRFNGFRLLHTHLKGEPLSSEDLSDLANLRLDMILSLDVEEGMPGSVMYAHLLPFSPSGERHRVARAHNVQAVAFDFLRDIREIENEFQKRAGVGEATGKQDRVLLVGVRTKAGGSTDATMDELAELARSAGLVVANSYLQSRFKLDPRYLIGKGKLHELVLDSMQLGAEMIIFDCELTPAQTRTLARETEVEVLDRNQLILALFGQRAQSRAGRLQVELASLRYELPRISRRSEGLSRITGGIGALGPGETKMEIHKRRIRDRITKLERYIDELGRQRELRRGRRSQRGVPVVAIVGYTNSGKSTLINKLTASKIFAEDRMFATLDPTSRRIVLGEGRELVVTDTVGFIRDLPKELMSAFRATLEEVEQADLLLHLVDISDPDHESHIESVDTILEQLEFHKLPRLLIFNKMDRLEQIGFEIDYEPDGPLVVSAETGKNLDLLLKRIGEFFWLPESSEESD